MHAKSGLRVFLEWKIYRPDSVIATVIRLLNRPKGPCYELRESWPHCKKPAVRFSFGWVDDKPFESIELHSRQDLL